MELVYSSPAKEWVEALPLGNGRLGAMVYGDYKHEIIQLNEETLWSGRFDKTADNPDCASHLDEIRNAIFSRDYKKGQELTQKYMVCRGIHPTETTVCTRLPESFTLIMPSPTTPSQATDVCLTSTEDFPKPNIQ